MFKNSVVILLALFVSFAPQPDAWSGNSRNCAAHAQKGESFIKLDPTSGLRIITDRKELDVAGRVMAAAFDDGRMNAMLGGKAMPRGYLDWLFPVILKLCYDAGSVIVTNENGPVQSVGIWEKVGSRSTSFFDSLRSGLILAPIKLSQASKAENPDDSAIGFLEGFKKVHELNVLGDFTGNLESTLEPTYFPKGAYKLHYLATDPSAENRNDLAKNIMLAGIKASRDDQLPIYIETQRAAIARLAQKQGFVEIFHGKAHSNSADSWILLRQPDPIKKWGTDLSNFKFEVAPNSESPLLVRASNLEDLAFVTDLFGDAIVKRLFAVDQNGSPLSPIEELEWSSSALKKGEGGYFIVEDATSHERMGVVVFWKVNAQDLGRDDQKIYVRTGIAFSKTFRRKGNANIVGPELIKMGLEQLGIDHIVARVHFTNQLSINTTLSMGYQEFKAPDTADWRYFAVPAFQ